MSNEADAAVTAPPPAVAAANAEHLKAHEELLSLKRTLAEASKRETEKDTMIQRLQEHTSAFDTQDKARLTSYKDDIDYMLTKVHEMPECEQSNAIASELSVTKQWTSTYGDAAAGLDIKKHAPIATALGLGGKRMRLAIEAASVNANAVQELATEKANSEALLEQSKAQKLTIAGLETDLREKNQAIETLSAEMQKYGVFSTAQCNFSKVSAREKDMEDVAKVVTAVSGPAVSGPAVSGLAASSAESERPANLTMSVGEVRASKRTPMDPLLTELLKHSTCAATGRVLPSQTSHALLGASSSASDGVSPEMAVIMGLQ